MNVINQLPWEKSIDDSTWTRKDQYGFLSFFWEAVSHRFQTLITKANPAADEGVKLLTFCPILHLVLFVRLWPRDFIIDVTDLKN
jgi:hypothetical protein